MKILRESRICVFSCLLSLVFIAFGACDSESNDPEGSISTGTQTPGETESEAAETSTESQTNPPSTDEPVETESPNSTLETESQTSGTDTIAAACDALEDCEWEWNDCIYFHGPDDRVCVQLSHCGGTKFATQKEGCQIQCLRDECDYIQAEAVSDGPAVPFYSECMSPAEPWCF